MNLLFAFLNGLTCVLWGQLAADPVAEASALVVQGRRSEARQVALRRALKRAVLLAAEARRPKPRKWRSRIRAQYRTFVLGYQVLEEAFSGSATQGTYHVKVQVHVDHLALARTLDELSNPPKRRCVAWTWAGGVSRPVEHALSAALRGAWVSLRCGPGERPVHARGRCGLEASGPTPSGFGATIVCQAEIEERGRRRTIVARAAGLAPTLVQARARAETLAASRLGWKLGAALNRRVHCTRLWSMKLVGPWPQERIRALADQIRRRLGPGAVLSMEFPAGAAGEPAGSAAAGQTSAAILVRSRVCGSAWLRDLGFADILLEARVQGSTISLALRPKPMETEGGRTENGG